MDPGVAQLAEVIAAVWATWDEPPSVEPAIYGTADALAIAGEVDAFCRRELGGAVARALFYEVSQGSVTAVELVDGRRLVIKARTPEDELAWLQEIVRVQMHLASRGLYATTVCGGPAPIGRGLATVEALVTAGATRDGREPAVRVALARGLHAIVTACRPLVAGSSLRRHYLADPPRDALYPNPADFVARARGAGWIDDVARAARARMQPVGEIVIGHGDWRVQHVRFEGERIVAAFDWDGLCKEREPALLGFTAFAFCVDWTRTPVPVTTIDDARAFVADYEAVRGASFTIEERRLCGAMFAYSYAYLARCMWNVGDDREKAGTFQHVVASHGPTLMEL
jgi:hypothetical protein